MHILYEQLFTLSAVETNAIERVPILYYPHGSCLENGRSNGSSLTLVGTELKHRPYEGALINLHYYVLLPFDF